MLYSNMHYLEKQDMDDELKIDNGPKPRWHPNRNNGWYVIQEYDITGDEWRIIHKTKNGREAENLLILEPTKKRQMYLEREENQCTGEQ